jgi:hypothetical protein
VREVILHPWGVGCQIFDTNEKPLTCHGVKRKISFWRAALGHNFVFGVFSRTVMSWSLCTVWLSVRTYCMYLPVHLLLFL